MPRTVFPYPGGKSRLAEWILSYVPEHTCFVEVFGGAAGVLMNKDASTSTVEVYNDADGDLVQFFEVLRERSGELIEWLEAVPYSRAVHAEWAEQFYNGYRASDDVVRAGQFFFLRYSQWGAKYASPSGFGTSKVRTNASAFSGKVDRLEEFAERFDDVVIESLEWCDVFDKYDGPETVFYCDPPYVGKEEYYRMDFDHEPFVEALRGLEGHWLCSYEDLPAGLNEYPQVTRDGTHFIDGTNGSAVDATERLVLDSELRTAVSP